MQRNVKYFFLLLAKFAVVAFLVTTYSTAYAQIPQYTSATTTGTADGSLMITPSISDEDYNRIRTSVYNPISEIEDFIEFPIFDLGGTTYPTQSVTVDLTSYFGQTVFFVWYDSQASAGGTEADMDAGGFIYTTIFIDGSGNPFPSSTPTETPTYIRDVISPITSPTDDDLVTFEFDYFVSILSGYDYAGIQIRDITAGYDYPLLYEQDIVVTAGIEVYEQDVQLIENNIIIWRPYLTPAFTSSSTPPVIYGDWREIAIVSDPFADSFGSGTATTSFFGFLNVPDLLETKKPFSYLFQMWDILENIEDYPSSTAGSISLDMTEIGSSTPLASIGTITMFSTSTVTHFISPSVMEAMRLLLVSILYITVGFYFIRRIQHLHI